MKKLKSKELKRRGYIEQKGGRYFSARVKMAAGNVTSDQMAVLSDIASKYGRGYIGLTVRMNIEIPWISYQDIDLVDDKLKEAGFTVGGMGPTVRPIVACKGTICEHGLVDTQGLCRILDEKHFGRELPSKLKIGIAGCPNSCSKAEGNDIGLIGQCIPKIGTSLCSECHRCTSACKPKAIYEVEGGVDIDKTRCIRCGSCVQVCPEGAMTAEKIGFAISLGGKFGREKRIGRLLDRVFSMKEVILAVDKIIDYHERTALPGERLGDLIERIGFDVALEGMGLPSD